MVMKYVFIALLAAAIAVFALQNSAPTAVRFLLWTRESTPLATIILLSVAAGIVLRASAVGRSLALALQG